MRVYIHPRSLRETIKREYLKVCRLFGSKILIEILGRKDQYWRCIVGLEADPAVVDGLKKLGVRITKKRIPALFSTKVLADLANIQKIRKPIGLGQNGEIIYVDVSKPIATSDIRLAIGIADTPTLWLDFKGDPSPARFGYREYLGLPIPSSETKLFDLSSVLAKIYRTSLENVLAGLKARISGILEDKEIIVETSVIDSIFEWSILATEDTLGRKNYIDFSGLPLKMAICAISMAAIIWDDYLIVRLPAPWWWVSKILINRPKTIVCCDEPISLGLPITVLEDKVVEKLRFKGTTETIEKRFKPFWMLLEGG